MGNRLFRRGRPELASEHFHEALHQLEQINGNTDAEKEALLDLKNAINVNLGACYLKLGGFKGLLEAPLMRSLLMRSHLGLISCLLEGLQTFLLLFWLYLLLDICYNISVRLSRRRLLGKRGFISVY